jgi:valyl-tRNA synthetase
VLVTARDIIFLWVARMVMMGVEFTGELPFTDVPITSVIQAPDGRRMSKSLGTGIDPLDEFAKYGADAVRFGLLAMSSTQDVRYSEKRVKQGLDLANKLWNVARFVILNVDDVPAEPRPETVEDRWILSRLSRAVEQTTGLLESYQFSRAALELYDVLWGELCDWYVELVKPRLYEEGADKSALSANLLHVLEQMLKLLHPMMPFVTEEIWSFLPGERGLLAASEWPSPGSSDPEAEHVVGELIEAVSAVRRWRDELGVKASTRVRARLAADGYEQTAEHLERLARLELVPGDANGDVEASIGIPGGAVQVFSTEEVDPEEAARLKASKVEQIQTEIARAEGKLANEQFVAKAPPEVVQAERDKLERLRKELEELGE